MKTHHTISSSFACRAPHRCPFSAAITVPRYRYHTHPTLRIGIILLSLSTHLALRADVLSTFGSPNRVSAEQEPTSSPFGICRAFCCSLITLEESIARSPGLDARPSCSQLSTTPFPLPFPGKPIPHSIPHPHPLPPLLPTAILVQESCN
ncbi:hypothetical protein BCV70DRAFT_106211 [Testicularia cyperi]|uniref:Uncharacterized protein n=1 Tax=Testicularia cyperi TaxID=1882483 RepID=A0A317XPH7_9BASI|nr:hypothetical protein BCV70DRAFT_106211 [Testicularia cyperi]